MNNRYFEKLDNCLLAFRDEYKCLPNTSEKERKVVRERLHLFLKIKNIEEDLNRLSKELNDVEEGSESYKKLKKEIFEHNCERIDSLKEFSFLLTQLITSATEQAIFLEEERAKELASELPYEDD